MQIYNKHHIEKLGMTDPIVRAHLDAQRFCQGITWEDMLHSLVISLVEAKDASQALALDYAKRLPPNPLIKPRSEAVVFLTSTQHGSHKGGLTL